MNTYEEALKKLRHDPECLRDRFAMAALTGLCIEFVESGGHVATLAKHAWDIADAMIAARVPEKK